MNSVEKDKYLLRLEWLLLALSLFVLFGTVLAIEYLEMPDLAVDITIVVAAVLFAITVCNAIKIEQIAGFYECANCHHKYVPTYFDVFKAIHMGRIRRLRCPKCNEKTWNKKVLE